MSEYPWNENNTFTWLSSLSNPFKCQLPHLAFCCILFEYPDKIAIFHVFFLYFAILHIEFTQIYLRAASLLSWFWIFNSSTSWICKNMTKKCLEEYLFSLVCQKMKINPVRPRNLKKKKKHLKKTNVFYFYVLRSFPLFLIKWHFEKTLYPLAKLLEIHKL